MQINYYQDASLLENYVDTHYREQDEEVRSLIAFLDAGQVITGRKEQISKRLFLKDIYYLEIVDRRCFAYLDKDVFQIDYSLKLFLEKYWSSGFVQIGKSLVVNLNRIDKISPDFNMRMHLILENGEQLVLNRAYKKNFMESLKKGRRKQSENH